MFLAYQAVNMVYYANYPKKHGYYVALKCDWIRLLCYSESESVIRSSLRSLLFMCTPYMVSVTKSRHYSYNTVYFELELILKLKTQEVHYWRALTKFVYCSRNDQVVICGMVRDINKEDNRTNFNHGSEY